MSRILTRTICHIGLLLIGGFVAAAELPETPGRYEVELIIFRHVDQRPNTPEVPAATSIFRPSPLDLTLPELATQTPETTDTPRVANANTGNTHCTFGDARQCPK